MAMALTISNLVTGYSKSLNRSAYSDMVATMYAEGIISEFIYERFQFQKSIIDTKGAAE